MTDTSRCPRCGQLNRCAQAGQSEAVEDCWCFHTAVDPTVLDSLPAAQRNQACLCPRCAQGLPAEPKQAD
ncbi:cysteine-rich CWC family protein [Aquipseudomonas campi]|uniref:Cysteine-rich CWC family protein n=1 Tax=Aquipseudomonas campi TaxID=2731681 RepID=A0A6M8FZI5_9GAMM|nr:cysteine-rich CWC family protein [Pseudomonas campi]QKE62565.1 cysteine-rich CWC family protein [Pseudomonas campi]